MAIEILMPAVVPHMTEGAISRWAKREGERIESGEVLLEVKAGKAVAEVNSQHAGVLGKILVPEGTCAVKVNTVIGLMSADGESASQVAASVPAATSGVRSIEHDEPRSASPRRRVDPRRMICSPLAGYAASPLDMDVPGVRGSEPDGRVLQGGVETATRMQPAASALGRGAQPTAGPRSAASRATPAMTAATSAATATAAASASPTLPSDAARTPSVAPALLAGIASARSHEAIPHSSIRRVIARRLTEAKSTIPHFYLTVDCDVDALLALRSEANNQLQSGKISVNDFVIKAAAVALARMPAVNASWTDDAIRRWHDVDVAVAVSTPTGLITPIVRHADRKSVTAISAEMDKLAARAREARLRPDEYQGGSFTVSNLGMYGIREFSAIINPPQACILAVGAAEPRPVVRNGALAVATLMTCTLSADHRVVDGALGAEYLAVFRGLIESPAALLV